MRKFSQLQTSFCVSILVHVFLLGALGVSGLLATKPRLEQGGNLTLDLIAAPQEPVAPSLASKAVTPVQESPPEKPVEKIAAIEPVKQSLPPELPPVISVPQPVQVAVVAPPVAPLPPVAPTNFHSDANSVKTDSVMVQAQPDVAAKPDYLKNPRPHYPELALRRHEEGVVLLAVKVTAQGRAASVEIKKSSGFPLLDAAAVAAVRDYEFEPARIGALTFASEIEVPVHFELKRQ